ncbi:D-alanyl-D-alanine carboxypeptidase family protein [Arthrobacter sp. TMN-49]
MQTFQARALALAASVILVLTGCSPIAVMQEETAAQHQEVLPAADLQVVWPRAASSLTTLEDTTPAVSQPSAKARPTASTAKVITALTVLQKHPLEAGKDGDKVVLDAADVKLYDNYVANGGSYVPVYDGMTMSMHSMLEAMLLPSANNIADTLAVWAFGSMDAYQEEATRYVKSLGMNTTTIGSDASGYDPATTSTPGDLALLARAAMKTPVIAEVVAKKSADIPSYGPVQNTNWLLGSNGVIGLKTGTSPQAGGVFMFAANVSIKGQKTLVVGAVMGAGDSSAEAMQQTTKLLASVQTFPSGKHAAAVR